MKTLRTVAELRDALRAGRRGGERIGLVPTMGALHGGHASLIDRARETTDVVVVSLFVNPTQFDDSSDLETYPRDEQRDAELAAGHGADILFAPDREEVYPDGFSTSVSVEGPLTGTFEGVQRGVEHFRGVTTVVTKLFNMVGPDVAFFGQKDAQQALVIRRMAIDLDFPVAIEICPTVREPDGLALSSRNVHLDEHERARAIALRNGLDAAVDAVARGVDDPQAVSTAAREAMAAHDVEPEYLALVDTKTLEPLARVDGDALIAVAAQVGRTRLIDNTLLTLN